MWRERGVLSVEGWLGASGVLMSCRAEKDVASCGGRGMTWDTMGNCLW